MEKTERNNDILNSIEKSRSPLLPFELAIARLALDGYIEKQNDLGKKMGEAMSQTSETWHDNAPADVIRHDSKNLSIIAEDTIRLINNAEVFDYDYNSDRVTLGSLVEVYYDGPDDTAEFLLTGVSTNTTPELVDMFSISEEVSLITIKSPIGKAIFDKKVGEDAIFTLPNGLKNKVTIKSIKLITHKDGCE